MSIVQMPFELCQVWCCDPSPLGACPSAQPPSGIRTSLGRNSLSLAWGPVLCAPAHALVSVHH